MLVAKCKILFVLYESGDIAVTLRKTTEVVLNTLFSIDLLFYVDS